MKARDYFDQFKAETEATGVNTALQHVARGMMGELEELRKARHAVSNSAFVAIVRELSCKWAAFARLVNKDAGCDAIKETGFRELLAQLAADTGYLHQFSPETQAWLLGRRARAC